MSGLCVSSFICWIGRLVYPQLCRGPLYDGCIPYFYPLNGYKVFYDYYQIRRDVESDETATEPKKKGELRTRYEGSHSPFGFIWQISTATGWSVDYILNKVNYQTLIMMLSDAPRYVRVKNTDNDESKDKTAEDEANDIVSFFQSNLKQ